VQSKRRIYQTRSSLEEAFKVWFGSFKNLKTVESESVAVTESLGRITADAVQARISSPHYHGSAMDGYAVRFADTFGASETRSVSLTLDEQAVPVNTGDPIPEGFNAVIMVEDVSIAGESVEIIAPVSPYQNVRIVGEDIVQTELILPENHLIRPVDIGAMLSGGNTAIDVRRKPLVTIIPTGGEVVDPGASLARGNIIDSSSYMIGNLVNEWGGAFHRTDVVADNKERLKERLSEAARESDLVVVLAGASAGTKDFTPNAVGDLGEILVHGISIKPGKPVLLGVIHNKPVIGLPGYPVASYLTFEMFGKPLLHHLMGVEEEPPEIMKARLSRPAASSLGQEEFLRVKVGKAGDDFMATPVGRGAGALMTLQRADGIVRIPPLSEGIAPGTEVDVALIRSKHAIENTLVCIGSHDNALDLLANFLRRNYPTFSMSSAHVGSMGGLMAIKKSEAHLAGTHLLDEKRGEYNIAFIKRLLEGIGLKVINLVYRQQGLIVGKGNPKNISAIDDLTRDAVMFVNRQPGSGTRLLTDKTFKERGINPKEVNGYDTEEYTHMGIASAVASGAADAGMGILTAAIALDLEFIPVAKERYDLVIRDEHFTTPMVEAVLEVIGSDREFKEAVDALGGYDVVDMGKVLYEQ